MDQNEVMIIREMLSRGFLFWDELTKKRYLTRDIIPDKHYKAGQKVNFIPDDDGIKWSNVYSLDLIEDQEGNAIYQFLNSFKAKGSLGHLDREYPIPNHLELFCLVYHYPDSSIIHSKHIFLLTYEQKIEWSFKQILEGQKKRLGIQNIMSAITYGDFHSLWKKVDLSNKEQVESTSDFFWNELRISLNLLVDLVSEINFYGEYLGKYGIQEERPEFTVPFSFHKYERSFLHKSSFCVQMLYSYWEKIAYLLFVFLQPIDKLKKGGMSLHKLIKALKKSMADGQFSYLKNPESAFNWFVNFENSDHRKLTQYRHPTVHFKPEEKFFRGDFYVGALNFVLKNITDNKERESLENEFSKLRTFVTSQLYQCNEGLQKAIDLIQEIPK